jgi:uncharacterized protein (TIGR00369 family)
VNLAETIQQRLKGIFPELLGIRLTEVTPERVLAELTVRPELCTAGGVMHGGAFMAFADTLGAVGTIANLPPGARTTTIESKTNFIGAARAGDPDPDGAPGACIIRPFRAAPPHGSRTHQPDRLVARRPAPADRRAAEVSLTSTASKSASKT